MGKQEKCKVHYCTNEREFGKNGQLMNYCSHCKKLNLLNKSGTWAAPLPDHTARQRECSARIGSSSDRRSRAGRRHSHSYAQ